MTKKHFEKIARTFSLELQYGEEKNKAGVIQSAQCIAALFREFNPNFDKTKFLSACGLDK